MDYGHFNWHILKNSILFKYLYFKLFLKWKAFTGMEQKEKYLYQTLGDLFLTQLI